MSRKYATFIIPGKSFILYMGKKQKTNNQTNKISSYSNFGPESYTVRNLAVISKISASKLAKHNGNKPQHSEFGTRQQNVLFCGDFVFLRRFSCVVRYWVEVCTGFKLKPEPARTRDRLTRPDPSSTVKFRARTRSLFFFFFFTTNSQLKKK